VKYAVNTWKLPSRAIKDVVKWSQDKMLFSKLLSKYKAFDEGETFKNYKKVIKRLLSEGYRESKSVPGIYIKGGRLIIVEAYIPTDADVYKECNEF